MEIIREMKGKSIKGLQDTKKVLKEFRNQDREHFIVIGLDSMNKPCYREITSIGTLNSCIIHPREIFKNAILHSCNAIIIAHNHPSGNTEPSPEDKTITKKLKEAGKIIDIQVLDSIIIGTTYKSIIEEA